MISLTKDIHLLWTAIPPLYRWCSILATLWPAGKFSFPYFKKTLNLICRPKLSVSFKTLIFPFESNPQDIKHITVPHIAITNMTKQLIQLKPEKMSFNYERYMLLFDSKDLHQMYEIEKRHVVASSSDVELMYPYFKDNHLEIVQSTAKIKIDPGQTKAFPLMLIGAAINKLCYKKGNSLLFFPDNYMCLSLGVNGKQYEYGLDRTYVYERYLDYLASYTARYGPPTSQS